MVKLKSFYYVLDNMYSKDSIKRAVLLNLGLEFSQKSMKRPERS